jgi:beta-fructofuranosidase
MTLYLTSIAALLGLSPFASAQSSSAPSPASRPSATTTYSQSDVPTGTAITGNYAGEYRPQVHYSPPQGFMNDPNGMFVDENGTYHLYYQCKNACDSFARCVI